MKIDETLLSTAKITYTKIAVGIAILILGVICIGIAISLYGAKISFDNSSNKQKIISTGIVDTVVCFIKSKPNLTKDIYSLHSDSTILFRDTSIITISKKTNDTELSDNRGATNALLFFITVIISALINLGTNILWNTWLVKKFDDATNDKVERIKSIADEGLLLDTFENINQYRKSHYINYTIEAELKPYNEHLFKCIIHKTYEKKVFDRTFKFKFFRIRNDDEFKNSFNLVEDDYEFIYKAEERGFSTIIDNEIKSADYIVTRFIAGSHLLSPQINPSENEIEYIYQIPENAAEDTILISYEIELLIEKDSNLFFYLDRPSFGTTFTLKYKDVQHEIEMYANYFSSSRKRATIIDRTDYYTKMFQLAGSWLLPQSGCVYTWYKIDKNGKA